MSHFLFWPTVTYFYPVGNTSAVYLTENLAPESNADILLLACGDPRHILYTIHVDETIPLTCQRTYDITCCDIDVAILARNALLFTLLAEDGVPDRLDNLWNLFYHVFVDETSLSILLKQCRKLIALAENVETWRAGPYGHFLTTCDAATLAGLRRMWTAYLDMTTFSSQQADRFQRSFVNGMEDTSRKRNPGSATAAARSAGPLALHVDEAVSRQFRGYWFSGTTDDGAQGRNHERLLKLNPSFAYSLDGDGFAIHYAADPLCGFHLAEAFASGQLTRPYERIEPQEMVRIAKDQFSHWCTSVSKRLKGSNSSSCTFVIRMFAGDVLKFCQALKYCDVTRSPVTPYNVAAWRLSTITFDNHCYGLSALSPAPLSFNIIDTSNILDHVGLINLLVVTAPLLRKRPSATLYTEALLKKGDNSSQADLEHICGDPLTMALLLGVVPLIFISRFTTRFNVYAELPVSGGAKQYHERLAWKAIGFEGPRVQGGPDNVSVSFQRLSFLPEQLANFLFHVYLQMFFDEDMESRFRQLSSFSLERILQTTRRSGILHYNRRSFALLVHLAKTKIETDWRRAMVLFEKLVMSDSRLQLGQHAYQELCCQLHLLGVYTTEWMSIPSLHRLRLEYECDTSGVNVGMFRYWTQSSIPQVVTVALVIPRDAIARLEPDFREIGTPLLHCDMQDGPRVNIFAVTTAAFGSLRVSGKGENRTAVIVEGDANAGADADSPVSGMQPPWRTWAPLIMTFSVPSTSVMDFGRNPEAMVGFALRATPNVASKFANRLGLELTVFRTKLRDAQRVFVLARPPIVVASDSVGDGGLSDAAIIAGHWQENMRADLFPERSATDPDVPLGTNATVHVQMNDIFSALKSFTIRIDVTNPDARATLADKQIVPTVNSYWGSSRSLDAHVSIGKHTFPLRFPLPVNIALAKLRIARKSSYVEVVAPLPPFDGRAEHDISNRFAPLSLDPDDIGTPTLGSIHRLNLDRCPKFELSKNPSGSNWFDSHLRLMFSELEEERTLLELLELPEIGRIVSHPDPDTLTCVKQTLRLLLTSAADATRNGEASERAFLLCDTSRRRVPYLYIVIARMCLDVGSHTVVADAFVTLGIPAVRAALRTTSHDVDASTRIRGPGRPDDAVIQRLDTDADETAAWFHLLPHLTERCRTWAHKTSCAYRTSVQNLGEPFARVQGRRSSLCMCGLGVGTEVLPETFKRIAPYLTRAAFSPVEEPTPPARGMPLYERDSEVDTMDAVVAEYRCRTCGKEGGRTCSACKRVRYCSRACQRADWKEHKKHCQ